jgi:signal transduction histidine kinase
MRNRKVFMTPDELSELMFRERQRERNRIARILHDDFLQQCHMIVLALQNPAADLQAIAEKTGEAMSLGRDLIYELRQPNASASLSQRIDGLARTACEPAGIRFQSRLSAALSAQTNSFADELFMCLAEAIRNAVRHAGASRISITEEWQAAQAIVRVTDDGCGIPADVLRQPQSGAHFGLHGMRERATSLGARFSIRSNSGSGTTVAFRFSAPSWRSQEGLAPDSSRRISSHTQPKGLNQ